MAHAMSYGLRTDITLTRDGRELIDETGLRTLQSVRTNGVTGAAINLGVSRRTIIRRLRTISARTGAAVYENGSLTVTGYEMIEQMERRQRLLQEQMEHLWRKPTLTCDGLVIRDGMLLLVRRGRDPFKGQYALPGGIVEYGETTEDCVVREVKEETGLETEVVRLIGVFSDTARDPRGHFITLLYELSEKGGKVVGGDDAESAGFYPLDKLPSLAFDHSTLVRKALGGRPGHSI
jgi:8-oxo-dGTP diphosphatase